MMMRPPNQNVQRERRSLPPCFPGLAPTPLAAPSKPASHREAPKKCTMQWRNLTDACRETSDAVLNETLGAFSRRNTAIRAWVKSSSPDLKNPVLFFSPVDRLRCGFSPASWAGAGGRGFLALVLLPIRVEHRARDSRRALLHLYPRLEILVDGCVSRGLQQRVLAQLSRFLHRKSCNARRPAIRPPLFTKHRSKLSVACFSRV